MKRTFQREMLRREAMRNGSKPSRYVRDVWDSVQSAKYGKIGRLINQAKGAKPKRLWKNRIESVLG